MSIFNSIFNGTDIYIGDDKFRLTNETYIDIGGDAEVHKITDDISVKIYKEPERAKELENKLTILCEKSPTFHPSVIAPKELVFKGSPHKLAGFSMRFLPDAQKLDNYFWDMDISYDEDKFDQQVANMLYNISDGLKAIHRSRVVVGDLKPDNILVSKGKAFVVDFDSAALLPEYCADSYTDDNLNAYVDPRLKGSYQTEGPFAFDPESDWWALGVIAFEMFLGTDPWGGFHPDFRNNKRLRAFNYSVVGLDENVKFPPNMRLISWLDNKPELKRYFQDLFSPNIFSRHSIDYVLERYFPRPKTNQSPTYNPNKPKKHSRPKVKFDIELEDFTSQVVKELEENSSKAKRRSDKNEEGINTFLDFMLNF
jgi:serine/threonine protein kinase